MPINFLWIDGSHEYKDVKKDFIFWEPYLVIGGLIAFHDSKTSKNIFPVLKDTGIELEGVKRVVSEKINNSNRFKIISFVDSITFAKKIKNKLIIENLKDKSDLSQMNLEDNKHHISQKIYINLDKIIGILGILIKKVSPRIYNKLKNL